MGDAAVHESARRWRDRKTTQGKLYDLIEADAGETPAARLAGIGDDDVLYIFGTPRKTPEQLAEYLAAEGLPAGHRSLKLFFANSGDASPDDSGPACYAERLYTRMLPGFPQIMVFGYFGEVSAEGFELHKTAAMAPGEKLEHLSEEAWNQRSLRASRNRVRFPPEDPAPDAED